MEVLFHRAAAAVLAVVTFGTCFQVGWTYSGNASPWRAATFASALMLAVGAHAAGHYVAARRQATDAHGPYFMPAMSLSGTGGAYVKLRWPIPDTRVLFRIFAAGPIAGFAVSSLLYLCGLPMSDVVQTTPAYIMLGDSLLTAGGQRLVFGKLPPTQGVMLHPIAMAGYFGLFFNFWHLLPAGRMDAGRVVYAVFGYRRALVISWVTIGALAASSVALSPVWLSVALFAALTLIRISRQHPPGSERQPLDATVTYVFAAMLVILAVTFVPVPVRLGP